MSFLRAKSRKKSEFIQLESISTSDFIDDVCLKYKD